MTNIISGSLRVDGRGERWGKPPSETYAWSTDEQAVAMNFNMYSSFLPPPPCRILSIGSGFLGTRGRTTSLLRSGCLRFGPGPSIHQLLPRFPLGVLRRFPPLLHHDLEIITNIDGAGGDCSLQRSMTDKFNKSTGLK